MKTSKTAHHPFPWGMIMGPIALLTILLFNACYNHYLLYQSDQLTNQIASVDFNDQFEEGAFGVESVAVMEPRYFAVPVEKKMNGNTEKIANEDRHFTVHPIEGKEHVTRLVTISNQFTEGQIEVTTEDARWLLTPTQKIEPIFHPFPNGADHYVCYYIPNGPNADAAVRLKDQFGQYDQVTVQQAIALCVPAEKVLPDGEIFEIKSRSDWNHLTLYRISQQDVEPISIMYQNQFVDNPTIEVNKLYGILVPTKKWGFE